MARIWLRKQGSENTTTANTLSGNVLIYQNSREQAGNVTLVQKATVVATVLWGLTDTDDTWSMTLIVEDESQTAAYNDPELNAQGGSDPQIKGHYIFGRGPVLYTPRRLITIPVEHKLVVRINKEEGGSASELKYHVQFLLNTRL